MVLIKLKSTTLGKKCRSWSLWSDEEGGRRVNASAQKEAAYVEAEKKIMRKFNSLPSVSTTNVN